MTDRFLSRLIAIKGAEQGKARGKALDTYAAFGPLVADVLEVESWLRRPLTEAEARKHSRAFLAAFFVCYDAAKAGRQVVSAAL